MQATLIRTFSGRLAALLLVMAVLAGCAGPGGRCDKVECQNGGTWAADECACKCPRLTSGKDCATKDQCYGVTCLNGASCKDGKCGCLPGWDGKDCGSSVSQKFIGSWLAKENCPGGKTYNLEILKDSASAQHIVLDKLAGYRLRALIDGQSFIIAMDGEKIGIIGDGKLASGTLTINLMLNDLDLKSKQTTRNCEVVLTRVGGLTAAAESADTTTH